MRLLSCGIILGVLCLPICAAERDDLGEIAKQLGVVHTAVPKLEQAPALDKAPDFAAWAGPLPFAFLDGRAGNPPVNTAGYLACDAERIYAAVRCFDPDMGAVKSAPVPLDGNVWAGDSVEFIILPALDVLDPYYHFAVNPAGSLFDAKVTDKTWNSGAAVHVFRDRESWTAVIAVPYKALGADAAKVSPLWRVNLHRSRAGRGAVPLFDLAWSPTLGRNNHVPARFGLALLSGIGAALDLAAANAAVARMLKQQVVFVQTFEKEALGFEGGAVVKGLGPGGRTSFLREEKDRGVFLARDFGDIHGLKMAVAYRCNADQHGVVIHGQGTVVGSARPGSVQVFGRGLKNAVECSFDADRQSRALDLGFDAFLFQRPYGHCQQGNMPSTPGAEWAVASFAIDDMYTNDGHRRINQPDQRYTGFRIYLNGDLPEKHFLELGWVVVWRGKDAEPPAAPEALSIDRKDGTVVFKWSPAKDNLMVSRYELLRKDGAEWARVTVTTMVELTLPADKAGAGEYAVRAIDVEGNLSGPSKSATLR